MLWILGLVLPGLALMILHIVLHRGWSLWASVGMMAVILAIGLYGWNRGRAMTDQALASFDTTDADLNAVADRVAAFAIDQQPFLQG